MDLRRTTEESRWHWLFEPTSAPYPDYYNEDAFFPSLPFNVRNRILWWDAELEGIVLRKTPKISSGDDREASK